MKASSKLELYFLVFLIGVCSIGLLIYKGGARLEEKNAAAVQSALTDTGTFHFEIVNNAFDQAKGLGGRSDVPHDYGMLFVFKTDGRYGFWMKDMLVPIDIIWLSDNGTILGIEDSVAPSTYPTVFYPTQPVRYVLETRAGEARRLGWEVGTSLTLPLPN
jgi:uncharacterized membrane protein (UPF0127 family)